MNNGASSFFPDDACAGVLLCRIWSNWGISGPSLAVVREDGVYDLSQRFGTMSFLLDMEDPANAVRVTAGRRVASLQAIFANSEESSRDPGKPYFLSPCDLQVVKASDVTFASSMIERVIEEKAGGDRGRDMEIRHQEESQIGNDLAAIKPGSPQALQLEAAMQSQGIWSQYMEVGIGPDAEVFTKAPILSTVGTGSTISIRSDSHWNNPEREVVLAVNNARKIVGASLGNDVNLRDIEGRSALLLGKAKDNNASCSRGPFILLFDATFSLDDVRNEVVQMQVLKVDDFVLEGTSSMDQISLDPLDLVQQVMQWHQYSDCFMLFLGILFAPTRDRDAIGADFTHKLGDRVSISSKHLGALHNTVNYSELAAAWTFGLRAFIQNLTSRSIPIGVLPS